VVERERSIKDKVVLKFEKAYYNNELWGQILGLFGKIT
jgi:hypothetical protein